MNSGVCFPRNIRTLSDHSGPYQGEDLDRPHKRRRISTNNAQLHRSTSGPQLGHTPELSVGYLPSPSLSDGVAADAARGCFDANSRHVPSAMDPVLLSGMYDYSAVDPKMTGAPMGRPLSPSHDGMTPLQGQYWGFMNNAVPNTSNAVSVAPNGSYISPYCTPTESYYSPHEQSQPFDENLQHTPMQPVDSSMFGHHRDSSFGHHRDSSFSHHRDSSFSHHRDHSFHHHRDNSLSNQSIPEEPSLYPSQLDNNAWAYSTVDPGLQLQSLQILENLAGQILSTMLSASCQEFMSIAADPNTTRGQGYSTLQTLFEQNKKLFSRDQLFILPDGMHMNQTNYTRAVRKANLATFVICMFRGHDVPFLDLDETFLDIFMPSGTGTRLLKAEGALFLELKTQAYIAIMLNSEASKDEVLERLFPRDLQLAILRRRPDAVHLAPVEQDFIGRLATRRQYLASGHDNLDSLSQLPHKYTWTSVLDEVYICVRRALEAMDAMKDIASITPMSLSPNSHEDPITKATLAAHAAITGNPLHAHSRSASAIYATPNTSSMSPPLMHSPSASFSRGQKRSRSSSSLSFSSPNSVTSGMTPNLNGMQTGPSPTSAPMTVQYAQARQSQTPSVRAIPFARRPLSAPNMHTSTGASMIQGSPSQRRPWTTIEEQALMDGLDRVKGPHWSQILALYGAGGSLSEALKDRNQVQLKDKARNLKLFFLKSGVDVPVYLQRVTGELKTRAPAQAAKREAKERAKKAEEERERSVKERGVHANAFGGRIGLGLALGPESLIPPVKQTAKVVDG